MSLRHLAPHGDVSQTMEEQISVPQSSPEVKEVMTTTVQETGLEALTDTSAIVTPLCLHGPQQLNPLLYTIQSGTGPHRNV